MVDPVGLVPGRGVSAGNGMISKGYYHATPARHDGQHDLRPLGICGRKGLYSMRMAYMHDMATGLRHGDAMAYPLAICRVIHPIVGWTRESGF